MDYNLVREFRERLIERYDAVTLVELLELSPEDIWEYFSDRCMALEGILEELGMADLEEE